MVLRPIYDTIKARLIFIHCLYANTKDSAQERPASMHYWRFSLLG